MTSGIPDRLNYRIGEVSALTGLPASVLRYWETEFGQLAPKKSPSGQRLYSKEDIEKVSEIKRLLYSEKLTIEGARKRLATKRKHQKAELDREALSALLEAVRVELSALREQL